MENILLYPAAFVLMLAVLIAIHEFGHYWVAKQCGVKVLRFSLGFGKVIWQKKIGKDQTEWALSLFPLGGYVKMLDESEGEVAPHELHRAFNRQSVYKRMLIVLAGPAFNFFLAIFLFWIVFLSGVPELLPILGKAPENTPAAAINIQNGDEVLSVNGKNVQTWADFRWILLKAAANDEVAHLTLKNEKQEIFEKNLSLTVVKQNKWEGDAIEQLGIVFFRPNFPAIIGEVLPNSVAEKAGFLKGDKVLKIDQTEIADWLALVEIVRKSADKMLDFEVQRGDAILKLRAIPEGAESQGGKLGIAMQKTQMRPLYTTVRYGFAQSFVKAIVETWDKSVFSLKMLSKMLTGEVALSNISGPVTIADFAGKTASMGWIYYLQFMALISLSLGVLNLLPVPVLDGGHLLYYVFEVIRQKPLSERTMELGQRVGMSFLLVLMVFAFFNDFNRLFAG